MTALQKKKSRQGDGNLDDQRPNLERNARHKALKSGPWTERAKLAWKTVAFDDPPLLPDETEGGMLKLGNVFANIQKKKQSQLVRVLRAHWSDEDDIISESESEIRDSLDEALTYFQLLELAIQTGYISLGDVKPQARQDLIRLLWAPAVQNYVRQYDYVAIGFLAKRLGVDIGYEVPEPPLIDKGAEGMFAMFLSQHRLWYELEVDTWLAFLDDYLIFDRDYPKDVAYRFLRGKSKKKDKIEEVFSLIAGAEMFLSLLSDLYLSLPEKERPNYGLFYLYWMARMLGWDSDESGFYRDRKLTDWAAEIVSSVRLENHCDALEKQLLMEGQNVPVRIWKSYQHNLKHHTEHLRAWWSETLGMLKVLKSSKSKSKK